jgi:hypothetical protein
MSERGKELERGGGRESESEGERGINMEGIQSEG